MAAIAETRLQFCRRVGVTCRSHLEPKREIQAIGDRVTDKWRARVTEVPRLFYRTAKPRPCGCGKSGQLAANDEAVKAKIKLLTW